MDNYHISSTTIAGAMDGQSLAQREIFEASVDDLLGVVYRYADSIEQAEDWLEEGYVKIFLAWHTRKPNENLRTWMRNEMAGFAARKSFERQTFAVANPTKNLDSSIQNDHFQAEELFHVLKSLPSSFRTIINLYSVDDWNFDKIAQWLFIPEQDVIEAYLRARMMMATLLAVPEPLTDRKNAK